MNRRASSLTAHACLSSAEAPSPDSRCLPRPSSVRSHPIPNRARVELIPHLRWHRGGVLKLEDRAVLGRAQPHLHLAETVRTRLPHHSTDPQQSRRLAGEDLTARVALELVMPTWLQVSTNRHEPAVDPLRRRQRVPHVLNVGGVCPSQ
jgi:hypothetical protein